MRYLLAIFSVLCYLPSLWAQCNSSGGTGMGNITPTGSWQTISNVTNGQYWTFEGDPCWSYTFSFCQNGGAAGWDTQITITYTNGITASGGYNDDYCSLQSELTWTPPSLGTYRVYVTLYSCNNSGSNSGATLAYMGANSSNSNSNFVLVGDATSSSPFNCVTLTAAANGQIGCSWDVNSTLDFTTPFSYDFTVNLGSNASGADGMAFVIQNDPSGRCVCGAAGGSLGAGGITNSLIIEMDTYLNTEDRDDGLPGVLCTGGPDQEHLDIWLNGVVNPMGTCGVSPGARDIPSATPLMNGGSPYSLRNGLDHTFRVAWTPGSPGTITATLMDATATTSYGTVSHTFDHTVVFGTDTPYFGFTASTGGLNNEQSFCLPTCSDMDPPFIVGSAVMDTSIYMNDSVFQILLSEPILCSTIDPSGVDFDLDCTGSTTATACNSNSIISATPISCVNDTTRYIQLEMDQPSPTGYANDWKAIVASSTGIMDTCSNILTGVGQAGANGSAVILPIELLQFTATVTKTSEVQLNWASASEHGLAYYEVERSKDGKSFERIGQHPAQGDNHNYELLDHAPHHGWNYYRLRMVERTAMASYSNHAMAVISSALAYELISLSPNPATDQIQLKFLAEQPKADATVHFVNLLGEQVQIQSIQVQTGENNIDLSIQQLPKGVYYIGLSEPDGLTMLQKFIKQ